MATFFKSDSIPAAVADDLSYPRPVGTLVLSGGILYRSTNAAVAAYDEVNATPVGAAGGDLAGTYPDPTVTQARGLRETSGPTTLTMGAVADGQLLLRNGLTIVGIGPAGGGDVFGPAGATDEALVRFDGVSGKLIQDSTGWTLSNAGLLTGSAGSLILPQGAAPAPTAEGQIAWDTDDDHLVVGDGAATVTLIDDGTAAGGDLSGTYPNPAVAAITETGGPTQLTIGAIADGQILMRSGATITSMASPGVASPTVVGATPYNVLATDTILLVDVAPCTINLPAGATLTSGQLVIKDRTGSATLNNILIDANGAETIDGEADLTLDSNYASVTLVFQGTEWSII